MKEVRMTMDEAARARTIATLRALADGLEAGSNFTGEGYYNLSANREVDEIPNGSLLSFSPSNSVCVEFKCDIKCWYSQPLKT